MLPLSSCWFSDGFVSNSVVVSCLVGHCCLLGRSRLWFFCIAQFSKFEASVFDIALVSRPQSSLWGHSGPLCHALSLLLLSLWTSILHCHSPGVATVAYRLRCSYIWLRLILVVTVATPGEWQCKIRTGGMQRLAVANGPNIFQMLLVI